MINNQIMCVFCAIIACCNFYVAQCAHNDKQWAPKWLAIWVMVASLAQVYLYAGRG